MKPVTVITGGAGGMGFAAANIFGHQGHTLLLCDVKEEALQSAAVSLKRQNMDVHYLVTDVSDREPERIAGELATMPLGRYGAAYEIGNLIDFLCSYRASYINGIDILMDEGTQAFTSTPQLPD